MASEVVKSILITFSLPPARKASYREVIKLIVKEKGKWEKIFGQICISK